MFSFIQYLLGYSCHEDRGTRIFVIRIRNATQKPGTLGTSFDSRPLWRGIISDSAARIDLHSEGLSSFGTLGQIHLQRTEDSNSRICNNRKIIMLIIMIMLIIQPNSLVIHMLNSAVGAQLQGQHEYKTRQVKEKNKQEKINPII
jgi:hypothetical protein